MKVLVACEESQRVCSAFRDFGIEAYSCDVQPCSGGHPEWHILGDCIPVIDGAVTFFTQDGAEHYQEKPWDAIIAFPPCTDLACSGARHFKRKRESGQQQQSIDFFMRIINANCDRIAVENPIGIMSTIYRKPDQIIQPWEFGADYQKTTCLWLKGLPKLKKIVSEKPTFKYHTWIDKSGREKRQTEWYYATRKAGKDRGKMASKTCVEVAKAMADQWRGELYGN